MFKRTLLCCLATTLAACSPSADEPSAQPATTPSSTPPTHEASPVGFVDCAAENAVEKPKVINTDCITMDAPITRMVWPTWEENKAVGWGRLNGKRVKVVLSKPIARPTGEKIFGVITVDGTMIAP